MSLLILVAISRDQLQPSVKQERWFHKVDKGNEMNKVVSVYLKLCPEEKIIKYKQKMT
jgi:hypothetical protein